MAPPPPNSNINRTQSQGPVTSTQQSPLLAHQLSSGGQIVAQTTTISNTMPSLKTDSTASMSEGLAGHLSAVAKLPTQPVPPTSLTGVVQVQPNSASTVITPQSLRPQQTGIRPPVPGGIQNLLQSQVPIPPAQLPASATQQVQQQRTMLQQQQQQSGAPVSSGAMLPTQQ